MCWTQVTCSVSALTISRGLLPPFCSSFFSPVLHYPSKTHGNDTLHLQDHPRNMDFETSQYDDDILDHILDKFFGEEFADGELRQDEMVSEVADMSMGRADSSAGEGTVEPPTEVHQTPNLLPKRHGGLCTTATLPIGKEDDRQPSPPEESLCLGPEPTGASCRHTI